MMENKLLQTRQGAVFRREGDLCKLANKGTTCIVNLLCLNVKATCLKRKGDRECDN